MFINNGGVYCLTVSTDSSYSLAFGLYDGGAGFDSFFYYICGCNCLFCCGFFYDEFFLDLSDVFSCIFGFPGLFLFCEFGVISYPVYDVLSHYDKALPIFDLLFNFSRSCYRLSRSSLSNYKIPVFLSS